MAEKIVKVFFVFLLLLFPLGEIARFDLGNNIAVHAFDMVAVFALFAKKLPKFILFFVVTLIVSLLVNINNYQTNELITASFYLLRWVGYAGLYVVVSNFDKQFKNKIIQLLVGVGAIIVGLGYIQYFLYPNLRNLYYAGWDEHLYRMFSTFLDPNFAGAFFVMYFMFVLGKALENGQSKYYYTILGVLTLEAIFLTYSRSAYIMFGVALTVFFLLKKQKKLLFWWILGLVLLLPVLFLFSPKSEGTNLLRTTSSNARVLAMDQAITIIKDNPIFGVGFNAYRYEQEKRGYLGQSTKENHAGAGTDNSFLFVLATTGAIGFSAYFYLWYSIVRRQKSIVALSSIAGLFVNAFFINSLFYPIIMAWIWILTGITENE
ncbi:MAG: O-antigen ligase family protein [Candidatus Levyibacteriota bacterium]|nr:MAG: O-antigen ligase family protein [Candidatus Levybacteria bacterium]